LTAVSLSLNILSLSDPACRFADAVSATVSFRCCLSVQIYESLALAAVALICMLNDSRSAAAAAAAAAVVVIGYAQMQSETMFTPKRTTRISIDDVWDPIFTRNLMKHSTLKSVGFKTDPCYLLRSRNCAGVLR